MQKVHKAAFEPFDASQLHVGIVVSQFNRDITERLLEQALEMLEKYKIRKSHVSIYRVAGSIEIPLILKKLAETKKYDCLVALGAVIRGETPHFEYVAKIVSEGVLRVMLDFGIPIGFGVLTTENHEQAQRRVHVGGEAAEAAVQSARVGREIDGTAKQ